MTGLCCLLTFAAVIRGLFGSSLNPALTPNMTFFPQLLLSQALEQGAQVAEWEGFSSAEVHWVATDSSHVV